MLLRFHFFDQVGEHQRSGEQTPAVEAVLPRWQLTRQGGRGWLCLNGAVSHEAEARILAEQLWLQHQALQNSASEPAKSLASAPLLLGSPDPDSWQERYAEYISRTFEKTISGTALSQTSQVLQKISQLLVLWVGATLVLSGDLTLGQLIAFRIISGYVTQPLLRLSTIWQSIQELKVSFERLADVIDTCLLYTSDAADE